MSEDERRTVGSDKAAAAGGEERKRAADRNHYVPHAHNQRRSLLGKPRALSSTVASFASEGDKQSVHYQLGLVVFGVSSLRSLGAIANSLLGRAARSGLSKLCFR